MPITKSFVYVVLEVSSDMDAQAIADAIEPAFDADDLEAQLLDAQPWTHRDPPEHHHFVIEKLRVVAKGADKALDGIVSMATALHEARVAALYFEDAANVAMAELRDRGFLFDRDDRANLNPLLSRYGLPPMLDVLPEPSALTALGQMRERAYAASGIVWDPADEGDSYEGSFGEAADNEGARTAAAAREDADRDDGLPTAEETP